MTTQIQLAISPFYGQGWLQVAELLLAFALSAAIGLERQLRGKPAGLRTQTIVGTTAAVLMLVSKYGFSDILLEDSVSLDPSRIAAQIVSGVGFLGAGLILTRHGAVRGLTTAAAVWETAAIGMAAGAGLWLLALVVTMLHFIAVFGFTALSRYIPSARDSAVQLRVTYLDGQGVLRAVLAATTAHKWEVHGILPQAPLDKSSTTSRPEPAGESLISVGLEVRGSTDIRQVVAAVREVEGVQGVHIISEEDLD